METERNMYDNSLIGMKADRIEGIYVRVTRRNDCTDGRLDSKGKVDDRQAFKIGANEKGEPIVEGLSDDTISVERIWDERYWFDFLPDADSIRDADAVIVDGKAYPLLNVVSADNLDYSTDNLVVESIREDENGERRRISFPVPAISHVLELKEDAVSPAKGSGLYRDRKGDLWINSYGFLVKIERPNEDRDDYRAVLADNAVEPDAFPFVKISDDDGNIKIPSDIRNRFNSGKE